MVLLRQDPDTAHRELNLEGNRLEDAGWEELSSGIRRNTSLAVINLSNNRFGNSSAAIEAFRDAFAENRSLQYETSRIALLLQRN